MPISILDWQILWDAATGDIPELRRQVHEILTASFRNSNPIESRRNLPTAIEAEPRLRS